MAQNKVIENQTEILKAQADPIGIQAGIVLFNNKGKEEEPIYRPMYHGKGTDPIAYMVGKKPDRVDVNGTAFVTMSGIEFSIADSKKKPLGVGAHKLLAECVIRFMEIGTAHRYAVIDIPLRDYAIRCGWDIIPHDESQKEKKRAENSLRNFRKKVNKDITALYNISIPLKDSNGTTMNYRLLAGMGIIRNSYIHIELTPRYADFIIQQRTITQYPDALMRLDERNQNAYILGLYISQHYFMDNNQARETAQSLKVISLIQIASLPSIENVKAGHRSWNDRIKEPLEEALEELVKVGLIAKWEYTHSKGKARTDKEASFKTYEEWIKAIVRFELVNPPDQKERLERRAEEKKAAIEANQKKKPKKKSKEKEASEKKKD